MTQVASTRRGNGQQLDVPAYRAGRDGEATTAAFEIIAGSTYIRDLNRLGRYYLIATVSHTNDPILCGSGRWDNNVAAKT